MYEANPGESFLVRVSEGSSYRESITVMFLFVAENVKAKEV